MYNNNFNSAEDLHLHALEEVRASGKTNMMDAQAVVEILDELEYWETFTYLTDERGRVNKERYLDLLTKLGKGL